MPIHPSYNHNIAYAGHTFHVQSEVSGPGHRTIVTHVFFDGDVIAAVRAPMPEDDTLLATMQKQHQDAMRALVAGQHDAILRARGIALRPPAATT